MKKLLIFIALCLFASVNVLSARQNVIFETDMGNDVDDALALDMLYKYSAQKKIRLLGIMLNKEGIYPPMFIDLLNTWYGQRRIPIGVNANTIQSIVGGANYTQVVVEEKDAQGKPLYKRSIKDYSRLLPTPKLYRKLLKKAKDHSVTIVSVGFSTNLALLLDTPPDEYSSLSGRELVERKVNRLVMMAGHIEDPNYREYNVVNDIEACRRVYEEWPTAIYTSPFELGLQIRYPASSIENDFSWAAHHPVVDAYKAYLPKLEDRPTWDLTAVLYAVDAQQFFIVSPPGRITVTSEGCTHFLPDAQGRHHYLSVTPQQAKQILDYFVQMITKEP